MTHTKTPWGLSDHRDNDGAHIIVASEGGRIAAVFFRGKAKRGQAWNAPDPEGEANAALIVRAVNSFDALVEQVKLFEHCIVYEIKKAEKEGDDEGVRMKLATLAMCRAALKSSDQGDGK